MTSTDLDLTAYVIDVRDIIERVEQIEIDMPEDDTARNWDGLAEWDELMAILKELEGMGGDEQWNGAWYPVTLIRDSYFQTYAQELAEETGAIDSNATWPNNCIDWEWAARELRYDYASLDINGITYLTR